MNLLLDLRFLRPYLHNDLSAVRKSAYRSFKTSCHRANTLAPTPKTLRARPKPLENHEATQNSPHQQNSFFINERIKELEMAESLHWPRIERNTSAMTVIEFLPKYEHLDSSKTHKDSVTLRGKIQNIRIAGKALVFIDLVQEGWQVQAVCNATVLEGFAGNSASKFKKFYHLIQRGDYLSVIGNPYRTKSGQLSLLCSELPKIISPSLAPNPRKLEDPETRIRNRHLDLLVHPEVAETLRLRSHIIQHLRNFLLKDRFLEVQTPLIVDKASGAVAKPFVTTATEFPEKQLALRIAPEIWLKRLIIGGIDRVFEIGPAFRNEGLDATHNPEFTTCEFYKAYTELEELMEMTEKLFLGLAKIRNSLPEMDRTMIPEVDEQLYTGPYKRIAFIPAIEEALGLRLPNLELSDSEQKIIEIFKLKNLPLPSSPTLPRLLDKLAASYIEPRCIAPTFITHHPSVMSPLAKSFYCPKTNQLVSARAELFINKREIANMYEEENSPIEQREKFLQQQRWKDDENEGHIDESYIEALQFGLPPTGGWGCGVDRIVMLFSGAKRISDVLAFGSLRNVVNLGNRGEVGLDLFPHDAVTKNSIRHKEQIFLKGISERREEMLLNTFKST